MGLPNLDIKNIILFSTLNTENLKKLKRLSNFRVQFDEVAKKFMYMKCL